MNLPSTKDLLARYQIAKNKRTAWEGLWQDCYDFALPSRDTAVRADAGGPRRGDRLFDGTAPDAVDQLAASMMSQLTPPWARWFGFSVGPDVAAEDRVELASELERATTVMQSHFDRSNVAVEMHQCYLDLVTAGTASLLFEEAAPGDPSAFRFTAVPLVQAVIEEGPSGRLDVTFRRSEFSDEQLVARFPSARAALAAPSGRAGEVERRTAVIEAVLPTPSGYAYNAFCESRTDGEGLPLSLAEGRFSSPPFVNFRWLKAPGETYGRSPVMKALPDIKIGSDCRSS